MKLLLNDKEIAYFLISLVDHLDYLKSLEFSEHETNLAEYYILEEKEKAKFNLDKMRQKFKDKIRRGVSRDVRNYIDTIKSELESRRKFYFYNIHQNIDYFINKLGEDQILELYKKNKKDNFVKSTGFTIDPDAVMMRRKNYENYQEDCLVRNTVGNEGLLISKIDNNYPFWFIDSGYTNFLESNKKWHRLVRNHLHFGNYFDAPVDRMSMFKSFPEQWRTDGEIIMVVEPGPFAAGIFHVDLKTWKYDIEKELRNYTDKKIVFREKAPKKKRSRLIDELRNEDYYCIININSNAATEAIWAGVPAITLDKHITNPVTRNRISDINNLYRGNLAQWLAMLSYSQFTYEELINGTAARILKKYHV